MKMCNYDIGEGSDDLWLQLELLSALYYRLLLKAENKEKFSYEFREALESVGIPLHNFVYKNWIETKRNMNHIDKYGRDEEKTKKMLFLL